MALVIILYEIVFHSFAVILILDNSVSAHNITSLLNDSSHFDSNSSLDSSFPKESNGRNRIFFGGEDQEKTWNSTSEYSLLMNSFDANISENGLDSRKRFKYNSFVSYLYNILNYGLDFDSVNNISKEKFNSLNSSSSSSQTVATNDLSQELDSTTKMVARNNFTTIAPIDKSSHQKNISISDKLRDKRNISNQLPEKLSSGQIRYHYLNDENAIENKTESTKDLRLNDTIEESVLTDNKESLRPVSSSRLGPKTIDRNHSERVCFSSRDCNIELNERCIKRNKNSICGCKEPFFRESYSHNCQIKKLIRLLFRMSSHHSKESNNSVESLQMKHLIETTIWSVIINSSYLISTVDGIKALNLKDLEIIVDFYVKIADPSNDFHHKYIEYNFWYRLMTTIRGIEFRARNNENRFDLRAIEVVDDINYCSVKELNYCSDFADCIERPDFDNKFFCKCKSGLTDLSPNINYSGEVCALKCSTDLCGTGGICEVRNQTEIHCICKNWNFGDRCQYSLHALLAVISLIGLLSIFFSFCLAALYCGFKIHREFVELKNMIDGNSHHANSIRII